MIDNEKNQNDTLINDNIDLFGIKYSFYDKPINGVQISIRKTNSWEYCMKPATKLNIESAPHG